jgi:hypothetical protein
MLTIALVMCHIRSIKATASDLSWGSTAPSGGPTAPIMACAIKLLGGHGMETIRGYADVIITMIGGAEGLYPTVTVIKCLQKISHRGIVHLRTVI